MFRDRTLLELVWIVAEHVGPHCFLEARVIGVAVGMTEAGEDKSKALLDELKTLFSASLHDVKLPVPLVKAMSGYYLETLQVESIDDVAKMDPDEMEEAAAEAWQDVFGAILPKPHALRVRKWAGEVSQKSADGKGAAILAQTAAVGDIASDDRRNAAKKEAESLNLTPFDKEKATKDMANQGLSCERIVALSLSLILGKVCRPSMVANLKYGEDPALCDAAKAARKADKKMLSKILKKKDYADLGAFFSDLMMDFSADGMITESSLVASWWAETNGCFSTEKELLFQYIEDYFEKYSGRGLPERIDTVLVTRLRNSAGSGGVGKAELEKLKLKIAEQDTKLSKLASEMNTCKQKLDKKAPTAEEQEERRKRVTCHICKKKGHYASECPDKPSEDG